MSVPTVAVVGSGYWGKNLVRTFHALGALSVVCDSRGEVMQEVRETYGVNTTAEFRDVLQNDAVQAVAIATPAATHFSLAQAALQSGKDVYVEKPLALNVSDCRELVHLAAMRNRILMVGHILQYHPAVLELKRLIAEGELGNIQYISSSRLNLGKLRTEENILWSFAPHDISAILFLLGEMPVRVASQGRSYLNRNIPDTTFSTCEFSSGVMAHIAVSWLHPFKEQKLAIVGGKKMAVFDDMEPERKLVVYAHRIDWLNRVPVAHKGMGNAVPISKCEPLRAECEHFLECVETRHKARTDGENGLAVLRVLEACENSLLARGAPVELGTERAFSAHTTAVIDPGCDVGPGTKIWHFSHIMSGARIGKNCNFGQNVVISPDVIIGDNVKLQNNVSVYTGVELEDDVFCGPSMVFTNVINPRSHVVRRNEYKKTLVKRGASIGANATIVCGVTLGRYSFVAAGAVVTHDVPDYGVVLGVPATRAGWMCQCGVRLPQGTGTLACPACQREYRVDNDTCTELTYVLRPLPVAA